MDIDRFVATNQPHWQRLGELSARAARSAGALSADEVSELVRLYQRASTHLSWARTHLGDAALVASLTNLVARSGAVIYGTRPRTLRTVARFFTEGLPAALWQIRWATLIAALLFCVPAFAIGARVATSAAALDATIPPPLQEALVTEDFAAYYTEDPAGQFFAVVGLNNIQVSFLAFAGGALLCVGTAYVLLVNALNVGPIAGLFHAYGAADVFWGLILPHGLLELTAIFVAGGAGLKVGWAVIAPGDRPRGVAVRDEGRRAFACILGLVLIFVIAAAIEAFVTGSRLPTWARVGVGAAAELAFLLYAYRIGRVAAQRGFTGALGESDEPRWHASPSAA